MVTLSNSEVNFVANGEKKQPLPVITTMSFSFKYGECFLKIYIYICEQNIKMLNEGGENGSLKRKNKQ